MTPIFGSSPLDLTDLRAALPGIRRRPGPLPAPDKELFHIYINGERIDVMFYFSSMKGDIYISGIPLTLSLPS